jgi:acetoin utilization protein AcuB
MKEANVKVRDIMSKDPVTIEPDTAARVAADRMREWGIRHLPVVDGKGQLLGMLTDRDLAHASFMPLLTEYLGWSAGRLASPRVRDLMTWSVITTHPEATLVQAALTMFQRRIGSLPVLEDGRLVGILTERDILATVSENRNQAAPSEPGSPGEAGDVGAPLPRDVKKEVREDG